MRERVYLQIANMKNQFVQIVKIIKLFFLFQQIMNKKDVDIQFKEKAHFPDYLVPQYIKLLEK